MCLHDERFNSEVHEVLASLGSLRVERTGKESEGMKRSSPRVPTSGTIGLVISIGVMIVSFSNFVNHTLLLSIES